MPEVVVSPECEKNKTDLEEKYVKAYVELSRLIAEYEEAVANDDAEQALAKHCEERKAPLEKKQDKLNEDLKKRLKELQDMRPKLEDMLAAEKRLRDHLAELSKACSQMDATGRGLDAVRDAIKALQACPGLVRPEFHIPIWVGKWLDFVLDSSKSDKENDEEMNAKCKGAFGENTRAAEVSEIEGGFIEAMPRTNTAAVLVVGTCPKCEGKSDDETGLDNKDHHARICWDVNKTFNHASRRTDCSKHEKAVMCVRDRGDLRKTDWGAYASLCEGSSTSLTQAESKQMLAIHNKMRCSVGSSQLKWSRDLQCQAQKVADKCKYSNSDSLNSPIPASENIATGIDLDAAAWEWSMEYTQENPARTIKTGHFTAMVWNSTTELGCGICRNGSGIIVCQYANTYANQLGNYDKNVPSYEGLSSDYDRCLLNKTTAKQTLEKLKGTGTLTPLPSIEAHLG
jgi:hypothetical protein